MSHVTTDVVYTTKLKLIVTVCLSYDIELKYALLGNSAKFQINERILEIKKQEIRSYPNCDKLD